MERGVRGGWGWGGEREDERERKGFKGEEKLRGAEVRRGSGAPSGAEDDGGKKKERKEKEKRSTGGALEVHRARKHCRYVVVTYVCRPCHPRAEKAQLGKNYAFALEMKFLPRAIPSGKAELGPGDEVTGSWRRFVSGPVFPRFLSLSLTHSLIRSPPLLYRACARAREPLDFFALQISAFIGARLTFIRRQSRRLTDAGIFLTSHVAQDLLRPVVILI
jgi:hypothetical protein